MTQYSRLSALLEAEEAPTRRSLQDAVDAAIQDPRQISCIAENDVRDGLILRLTTHSDVLAQFFSRVQSAPATSKTPAASKIAADTINLLILLLPPLQQLLELTRLVELLIPALSVCLEPREPIGLPKLASVLATCGDLLEQLVACPLSSTIICRWASLPAAVALGNVTQETWTHRLVAMVLSCTIDHKIAETMQEWEKLKRLKNGLYELERRLFDEEDKRASVARKKQTVIPFPTLEDDLQSLLSDFALAQPGSLRVVQNHIETLSGGRTSRILRLITKQFPCKHCIAGLGSPSRNIELEARDEIAGATSDLHVDILGKDLGVWKVALSEPALRSWQAKENLGLSAQMREKLVDLANGYHTGRLAGSDGQRHRLKVPLTSTKCGKGLSIIWQVHEKLFGEAQTLHQIVIVWEIGDSKAVTKAIDIVISIQMGYSDDTIRRCRQRPSTSNGAQLPLEFEDGNLPLCRTPQAPAELDIRTVDQETIHMANKFYALSEAVIRSVLANDLAAEFPFELSWEEARCINHRETASLILGRSGTGKTTCLVFKVVGKFVASKAVLDERPVRQVFLTRSRHLAKRLNTYTRRLIRTHSLKSANLDAILAHENPTSMVVVEEREDDSVLTLTDQLFPLVCTFDRFLQLLENTAIALDRQDFSDVKGFPHINESTNTERPRQQQFIDAYAFEVDYWPRFSHVRTKHISVQLVFAEIMGVIKGSESSRESLIPLSREDYLKRSSRLAPTFSSETERSRVYDIFEQYETMKHQRGDFDYVDRVVTLLKGMYRDQSLMQLLRSTFDEMYVDEVQDLRCLDIELLFNIVRDGRGFHFAGDTAQAISQDSTFRFADIKKMHYDHFALASSSTNQNQLGHAQLFALSENHRSHQAILALASLVMGMIWEGFPETVDRLGPEIGNLTGPKPVLFIGCNFSILQSSSAGSGNRPEKVADFGAEQVILVRDEKMKTELRGLIGDVALIFTILESKGMEFDDVILWDFFSGCPNQPGVRSLSVLKNEPAKFESWKFSDMCTELKRLYVAITRARNQLFIVETSVDTAATVFKLFNSDASGALTDITRPGQKNFALLVDSMRPSASVDPASWAKRANDLMEQRMFKDALMSFRKAGDQRGETRAQGHVSEEEGRRCLANDDFEGSTTKFENAYAQFMEVKLVIDAVRVLERMGKFYRAAELWLDYDKPLKAVGLFLKAGSYSKAVDCFEVAGQYSEAASILQDQGQYDRLVMYLIEHRAKLPIKDLKSYGFLCKLLLKQEKLSQHARQYAIELLGSSAEQEACFVQYGMDKELVKLYNDQRRFGDLYHFYTKSGRLGSATGVALTDDLLHSTSEVSEFELLNLLDYVWAGHLVNRSSDLFTRDLRLESVTRNLTPKMVQKNKQWETSSLLYGSNNPQAQVDFVKMDNTPVKRFLAFWIISNDEGIARISTLDALPFEMMQEAVRVSKDLVLKEDPGACSAVALITGLWKTQHTQGEDMFLPWSPIPNRMIGVKSSDRPGVARQWVLDKIAAAVQALHLRARDLWDVKWPTRCVRFLTRGFCPEDRKCSYLHEPVTETLYAQRIKDLMRINHLFCHLAVFYYRRILNEAFSGTYLRIRRYWLERLLRELTFLSALEQASSVLVKTQIELYRGELSPIICSAVEDLLFHRLRKQWGERNSFTSLLEQIQLAEAMGQNVQSRLFRAMSHSLFMDKREQMQRHLALMKYLKQGIGQTSASEFQTALSEFLQNLDNIQVSALSGLHSLLAVLEYLAAFLILKANSSRCLLTQCWAELYLTQIDKITQSVEPSSSWEQEHIYQQCLVILARAFCKVLSRLNESLRLNKVSRLNKVPGPKFGLTCSGKPHSYSLLRQRNAELLAIIMVNLVATLPRPAGFTQIWYTVKEAFGYEFVGADYLIHHSLPELIEKLALSFLRYNGKDSLLVVTKDQGNKTSFEELEGQPSVQKIKYDQLLPRLPTPAAVDSSTEILSTPSANNQQEQYSSGVTEAVVRLQRRWRACFTRIEQRRAFVLLPLGRAINRFFELGALCSSTISIRDRIAIRGLLVSDGVAIFMRQNAVNGKIQQLQQDAMACVENIEISHSVDESVDDVLGATTEAEDQLRKAVERMSDESLAGLIKRGDLFGVQQAFGDVEGFVAGAEQRMTAARVAISTIMRSPI